MGQPVHIFGCCTGEKKRRPPLCRKRRTPLSHFLMFRNLPNHYSLERRHELGLLVQRQPTGQMGTAHSRRRNTEHTRTDAGATAWDRLPFYVCS